MNETTFPDFDDPQGPSPTAFTGYPNTDRNQGQRNDYSRGNGGYQNNQQGGYQKQGYQKDGWKKDNWKKGNGGGGFKKNFEPAEVDPTIYIPYAVTGNENCPMDVQETLKQQIVKLEAMGLTTRTSSATELEKFANQVAKKMELILPWQDFDGKVSKLTWTNERAKIIAKMFHPTYDNMKKGIQLILAKNARLLLGDKMNSPARFLLIWTEDGIESRLHRTQKTGFAGHAIAIANGAGIPVYNLGNPTAIQRLEQYLSTIVPPQSEQRQSQQPSQHDWS